MLVSISFSAIIFQMLNDELDRFAHQHRIRIEQGIKEQYVPIPKNVLKKTPLSPPEFDPELLGETKNRILIILGIINGVILIVSGGLGYILAGKTLKPIKIMVDEQNRFVSDASHELRTPLTSLKLAMEVFLRDKHSNLTEAKDLIASSIGEVDRLHYLSENLLELSKYQHNQKNILIEKVSLSDIIDEAIDKVTPQLVKKQIEVVFEKNNQEVKVNKQEVADLLVILLDNAIKYSENKSKICINVKNFTKHIDLHIVDQGIGIAKPDLPYIFDRFYRADSARVKGGYGLGLSIAKKIATKNKVLLMVESTLNKGSDFTVRFLS